MEDMKTELIVNGRCSSMIPVTKGIFQGSVLSPLLFEIWIDELCGLLNSFGTDDNLPVALFYVDDIVLKAATRRQAQDLLDVCEAWLTSRRAKFNLQKCYLLKIKNDLMPQYLENPLVMYEERLVMVDEEEYLGIPTTSKGAKWNKLLRKQIDEALKVLNMFKVVGEGWPEWIRLILVKTFCLSKFNYCSPCTKIWLELNERTEEAKKLNEDIESLDKQILMYIFRTTLYRPLHLMRSMIQLDTIQKQLETMRLMVIEQVQRLHSENPWHKVKSALGLSSLLSTNLYLPRLQHCAPIVLEHQRMMRSLPVRDQVNLKMYLKIKKADRLRYENTGKLQHYILGKARTEIWMPEKLLFVRNAEQRKLMIDWRRGLPFTKRICPVCNETFNRRHLTDCDFQLRVPNNFYNENLHANWIGELEQITEDNVTHKWLKPGEDIQYTIIDSLLNNSLFDLAYLWLSWLERTLPTLNQLTSTQVTTTQEIS
jgi:hypothetical protein